MRKEAIQNLEDEMTFDRECSLEVGQTMSSLFDKVYSALEQTSRGYAKNLEAKGMSNFYVLNQFQKKKCLSLLLFHVLDRRSYVI